VALSASFFRIGLKYDKYYFVITASKNSPTKGQEPKDYANPPKNLVVNDEISFSQEVMHYLFITFHFLSDSRISFIK
jgi:hypothetical protein